MPRFRCIHRLIPRIFSRQNWICSSPIPCEFAAASEVLVKEFGEDPDDKGGMLLAQAVQAIVTKKALDELT
ncbi:hypothetical protein IAF42_19835, partial [Acinetobacter baumannii]|nr:hypothetical protein [Acinetobacter baumannii]